MPNFNLKLYNFEKEGKGVEVDEKKPLGVFQVFILYFRYFWKMTLYNAIQFANAELPMVVTPLGMASSWIGVLEKALLPMVVRLLGSEIERRLAQ